MGEEPSISAGEALGEPQSFGEGKKFLFLMGIEPLFLGRQARDLC
jgi:hypothetical protein